MQQVPWTDPDEVNALLEVGERVSFIDARPVGDYESSDHQLPGAIRVAPDSAPDVLGQLPVTTAMVVYGSGPDEGPEVIVARVLRDYGYPQVSLLTGGFEAWEQRGHPTECKVAMGLAPLS